MHVEVINAWYGVQGRIEENRGGQVAERLRQNVAQNGGRLVLNGDLNAFFGFDPAPGAPKQAAIHVRFLGQEHHLRANEGQPFQYPVNGPVEIINAWYGVEGGICENRGGQVQERLRQNVAQNGGRLVLNGDLNAFFGFDPAPGVAKKAGIHVRHNGQEHHLRANEGQRFEFPANGGNVNFQQQSFQHGHVEVINAWYGVQGRIEENRGGQVAERLRQSVAQNGGRLVLNGDLNAFFGFDPAPGAPKQAAIHVRHNGQEHHLRANEGQPFHFP